MTTTLAQLVDGVRNLSPLFEKHRVPDRALGTFFTTYQRRLADLVQQRDPQTLVTRAHIVIAATPQNVASNVGAGEDGGMPGDVVAGTPVVGTTAAGALVELTVDDALNSDVIILVADRVVNSASSASLTATGAGWTTNQFANRYAVIKTGTGVGQRRKISSNDTDTLYVSETFDPVPSTDSTFDVVAPVTEVTGQMGVVTQLPAVDARVAYTVSLDASGQAQIDLTAPLSALLEASVPLPPLMHVMGGTVWYVGESDWNEPLTILPYGDRHRATPFNAVYVNGERVYLAGLADDWAPVASIDLQYVPIPPALTARTDAIALPDAAFACLVAAGGKFAARRCAELGEKLSVGDYATDADDQERIFLNGIAARKRGRATVTREVF